MVKCEKQSNFLDMRERGGNINSLGLWWLLVSERRQTVRGDSFSVQEYRCCANKTSTPSV